MRKYLLSISQYLSRVETKTAQHHYAYNSKRMIPKVNVSNFSDDEIYNHIMNQISFIHFPEYAYLSKPSLALRNKSANDIVKENTSTKTDERYRVRMLRDIGN